MNSILFIGPFPEPINGCSYANLILHKYMVIRGMTCKTINTSTKSISSRQGSRFSFAKALSFLNIYFSIYNVFSAKKIYLTPGQTFFGVLKYSPFILICILLKKPYIIHVHGNYLGTEYKLLKGIKKRIFKYLLSNASAGIVLSESLRNNFDEILPEKKVHVIVNFVDDSIFKLEKIKTNDKLKILYLSNLMLEKGILYLLDSLIQLDGLNCEFEATIAGGIENSIQTEVEEKLEILKHKVKYVGTVQGEEKNNILIYNNVFVLPTFYKMEGQPISILEAMATGNVIVTTRQGGIPDVVSEENGYFIEPNSTSSITTTLLRIQHEKIERIAKIQKNNIQYAKNYFTEIQFGQKIMDIINQI